MTGDPCRWHCEGIANLGHIMPEGCDTQRTAGQGRLGCLVPYSTHGPPVTGGYCVENEGVDDGSSRSTKRLAERPPALGEHAGQAGVARGVGVQRLAAEVVDAGAVDLDGARPTSRAIDLSEHDTRSAGPTSPR